jgi:hypothetical protein
MAQQRFRLAFGKSVQLTARHENKGTIAVRLEGKGGKLFKTITINDAIAEKFADSLAEKIASGELVPLSGTP